MKIKGQTAMEYLMTYGWAILIIIVVVAALYAMGVFSTKGSVSCSPCFSYFAFVDYSQTTGELRIRNGARTVTITAADVSSTPAGANLLTDCSTTSCDAGVNIDIDGVPHAATDVTVAIQINYLDTASGLTHTDTATIRNK